MATVNLLIIRALVRDELNEPSQTAITDTEIDAIANDGYKDVAVKALCYENKIAFNNIATTQKIVPLVFATNRVLHVNYVEYKSGTTEGGWGMLGVLPQTIGHMAIDGNTPQFWFQWGDYLFVEPITDAATYDLEVYAACYPAAAMALDGDTPANLPTEFHEDVYFFTLAFAALKLKRWNDAANAYNRYIISVQRKRDEYIAKYPEGRLVHELPEIVTREKSGGR